MYIADMNVSEQQKKKKFSFTLYNIIATSYLKKVTDEMNKCMYLFTHFIIKSILFNSNFIVCYLNYG